MLRHACISFALLFALATAADADDMKAPKNLVAGYQGCKDAVKAGDYRRQPIRDYQRLLDCTKRALEEAKLRLKQLSEVEIDDITESLLNENTGLKSQLQTKDDRIATLEKDAADKDTAIDGLNDQVRALNDQVTALETEQTRLQGVIDGQRESLKDALKRNAELEARVTALDQKVADLNGEVAALTQQVKDLTAERDDAKKQISALWCHVDLLTAQRGPFYNGLKQALGNDPRIQIIDDTLVTPLDVLFDVGSAELKLEGRSKIDAAAEVVLAAKFDGDPDWVLQVNGHTDVQKYRWTKKFPKNNWELSVARSLSVVTLLEKNGVPGMRLAAAGYSEYRPIKPGASPEELQANRRVEFKLVEYSKKAGKNCDVPLPPRPAE